MEGAEMSKASREWKDHEKQMNNFWYMKGTPPYNMSYKKCTLKLHRQIARYLDKSEKETDKKRRDFESLWNHSLQYQRKSFAEMEKF
jgi:hypothetical protein